VRSRVGAAAVAAFSLLGLVSCGGGVPQQQNYATVYGTVYDGTTGQPLSGATVSVDSVLTATSASDGSFSIDNVPVGPFTAVEGAGGYQTHQDQGTVASGDHFLLNVTLYH